MEEFIIANNCPYRDNLSLRVASWKDEHSDIETANFTTNLKTLMNMISMYEKQDSVLKEALYDFCFLPWCLLYELQVTDLDGVTQKMCDRAILTITKISEIMMTDYTYEESNIRFISYLEYVMRCLDVISKDYCEENIAKFAQGLFEIDPTCYYTYLLAGMFSESYLANQEYHAKREEA